MVLCALLGARPSAEVHSDERLVKAAFLYNFVKFVEWPTPAAAPFVVGIVGDDGMARVVEDVVRGRTAQGRELVVRRLADTDDPRGCHLVFVTAEADGRAREVIQRARGAQILTVGETPYFLREGGMIRFLVDDSRIRFQIDAASVGSAGLRISSQLLSLAVR